ncbi:hypothetical protein BKA70DRAFT_1259989 [Coprinopsis sp. MPI-PUGE-AT-0042]|nr:hypothetical protein BKA70DRAFT_1259989 [Coprinopsis sp. MPI-PUGE-AT-0042]
MSDDEFERGRRRRGREDSSSSRDSSPDARMRRFPFKLRSGSDDEDIEFEAPPTQASTHEIDTPPSQQPLLRQALGFGATSVPVPTYEPTTAKTPGNRFLPGQDPSASSQRKTSQSKPRKKRKKNEVFQAQSNRWRVDPGATLDFRTEAQSFGDVLLREQRHVPVVPPGPMGSSSATSNSTTPRRSTTPGSRSKKPGGSGKQRKANQPPPVQAPAPITNYGNSPSFAVMPRELPPALAGQPPANSSISFPQDWYESRRHYRHDYGHGVPPRCPTAAAQAPSVTTTAASTPPIEIPQEETLPPPPGSASGSVGGTAQQDHAPSTPSNPNLETINGNEVAVVNGMKKVTRHGTRMVTILAEDVRSGEADHQLIEVKVPIRPAEIPEDGFWANTMDIVGQWQKSAARVDGPARVYTLRGKYRQVILRVNAANKDTFSSTNVIVKPDRTLEVVIESLPTPGLLPPPPAIPESLKSQMGNRQDEGMSDVESNTDSVSEIAPSPPPGQRPAARKKPRAPPASSSDRHYRKDQGLTATSTRVSHSPEKSRVNHVRQRSPTAQGYDNRRSRSSERGSSLARAHRGSSDSSSTSSDYDEIPQPGTGSTRSPLRSTPSTAPASRRAESHATSETSPKPAGVHQIPGMSIVGHFVPSTRLGDSTSVLYSQPKAATKRPSADRRGYETPKSEAEPEEIDEAISKLVTFQFQKEPGFAEFYMWHAKPTADNMVNVYRLVKKVADQYVGIIAPFRSKQNLIIEEKHLIRGIPWVGGKPGDDLIRNVNRTLDLLELYGPKGTRTQDSEVKTLLDDTSFPGLSENRIGHLLQVLEAVDRRWNRDHPKGKELEGGYV